LDLLQKLIDDDKMTMQEAMVQSKRLKEEKILQDKFVAEVGFSSWN